MWVAIVHSLTDRTCNHYKWHSNTNYHRLLVLGFTPRNSYSMCSLYDSALTVFIVEGASWYQLTLARCLTFIHWHCLTLSDFGRMLSVGVICFEDRFCTSKKGTWNRGRWAGIFKTCCAHGSCLALCRTALVSTGWTIHKRRNLFRRGETNAS